MAPYRKGSSIMVAFSAFSVTDYAGKVEQTDRRDVIALGLSVRSETLHVVGRCLEATTRWNEVLRQIATESQERFPDDRDQTEETDQPPLETTEPWQVIPPGGDQDIERLWNEGLTSAQIGARCDRDGHTILNRITLLRNQYGPEVVPYRKG